LDELQAWLSTQHNGVKTYVAFRDKTLHLAATQKENAALLHLLAALADRFIYSYEESPLPADVADRAFVQLKALVKKGASSIKGSDADKVSLLNEIASAELG
jgi:hypothetical protein